MTRRACVHIVAGLALLTAGCAPRETPADAALEAYRSESVRLAAEAAQAGTTVVRGLDGWLFFAPELRHMTAGRFWGDAAPAVSRAPAEAADPLPAILDFQRQLADVGVELLIVPVPAKSAVYPDHLSPVLGPLNTDGLPRLDPEHQAFYRLLRDSGVDVLDLTEVFLAERSSPDGTLYCRQDTHWSPRGCVVAAREIASLIRNQPWFEAVPKTAFDSAERSITIEGDLWRGLGDQSLLREELRVRTVGTSSAAGLQPVEPDRSSPVLLLGDSHALVFHADDDMHARGAGLADQLALELGFAVDLVAVRGSGATPARFNLLRLARRTPGYWAGKRLVIWCFSVRELTESDGWRLVPIGAASPD